MEGNEEEDRGDKDIYTAINESMAVIFRSSRWISLKCWRRNSSSLEICVLIYQTWNLKLIKVLKTLSKAIFM